MNLACRLVRRLGQESCPDVKARTARHPAAPLPRTPAAVDASLLGNFSPRRRTSPSWPRTPLVARSRAHLARRTARAAPQVASARPAALRQPPRWLRPSPLRERRRRVEGRTPALRRSGAAPDHAAQPRVVSRGEADDARFQRCHHRHHRHLPRRARAHRDVRHARGVRGGLGSLRERRHGTHRTVGARDARGRPLGPRVR